MAFFSVTPVNSLSPSDSRTFFGERACADVAEHTQATLHPLGWPVDSGAQTQGTWAGPPPVCRLDRPARRKEAFLIRAERFWARSSSTPLSSSLDSEAF